MAAFNYYNDWDSGYSKEQSTRPQTIGYALVDSPAGQCAWILEKFWAWTDTSGDPVKASRGGPHSRQHHALLAAADRGVVGPHVLGVVHGGFGAGPGRRADGRLVFPKEIFRASRRWAARQYQDIRYWSEPPVGGHFAAFEQPAIFVDEVRGLLPYRAITPRREARSRDDLVHQSRARHFVIAPPRRGAATAHTREGTMPPSGAASQRTSVSALFVEHHHDQHWLRPGRNAEPSSPAGRGTNSGQTRSCGRAGSRQIARLAGTGPIPMAARSCRSWSFPLAGPHQWGGRMRTDGRVVRASPTAACTWAAVRKMASRDWPPADLLPGGRRRAGRPGADRRPAGRPG